MTELEKIEAKRYETNAKVMVWAVVMASSVFIVDIIVSIVTK